MRRLHPLTGVLRTGRYGVVGAGVPLFLVGGLLGGFLDVDVGMDLLFPAMGGGGVLGAGYGLASYLRFRYDLGDGAFLLTSGVLARREREIPLERIQNVDVHRELVHRLLGLAVLRIETAGGTSTEAELRFVSHGEAERLQESIRRRRAQLAAGETREAPANDGPSAAGDPDAPTVRGGEAGETAATTTTQLFALTPVDLGVYGLTEIRPGAFFLSLIGLPLVDEVVADLLVRLAGPLGGPDRISLAMTPDEALAVLVVALPLVLLGGFLLGTALGVIGYYGFQLGRRGSDLVYERGLTTKYSGAIPVDKLQTLTVTETLFQRPLGYAGLRIETAGIGAGRADEEGSPSAVPLAGRDRVWSFASGLEGSEQAPSFERPAPRARRVYVVRYAARLAVLAGLGLAVQTVVGGLTLWWLPLAALPLAPVAAHLKWANRGYAVGESHLFVRNGFWRRKTQIVPYRRLQTVSRSRTVFQRRLGLADLIVDTASSFTLVGGGAIVHDLPDEVAADLRERLRTELWTAIDAEPPGPDPAAQTVAPSSEP